MLVFTQYILDWLVPQKKWVLSAVSAIEETLPRT